MTGRKNESRRPVGKSKCRNAIVCSASINVVTGRKVLVNQHREVLSNRVAEEGTEHADVKAAPISHAHDRLGRDLVSNTQSGSERLVAGVNVAIQVIRAEAANANDAFFDVGETAVALSVNPLREVQLPAQSVVDRQLGSDAPSILTVEEPTFLALRRGQAAAYVTLKMRYLA